MNNTSLINILAFIAAINVYCLLCANHIEKNEKFSRVQKSTTMAKRSILPL